MSHDYLFMVEYSEQKLGSLVWFGLIFGDQRLQGRMDKKNTLCPL